jgi:hypothetical protein
LETEETELAELARRLKQKKNQEHALLARVRDTELDDRRVLAPNREKQPHVPCSTPQCRGFVSPSDARCACCNQHMCADDDVATVQELQRNAKRCAECRVYISTVDGCDQMVCVSCHTRRFSWNTGQRIDGPIHNPHYFEVRARLGDQLAQSPAQPCAEAFFQHPAHSARRQRLGASHPTTPRRAGRGWFNVPAAGRYIER